MCGRPALPFSHWLRLQDGGWDTQPCRTQCTWRSEVGKFCLGELCLYLESTFQTPRMNLEQRRHSVKYFMNI